MLTGENLFDEKGRAELSDGATAELLGSYSGEANETVTRYKKLIAILGIIGTEMGRSRDLQGFGPYGSVVRANHSFIFPSQDALVMMSRGEDGKKHRDEQDREITHEFKRGAIEGYVLLNIGVSLDTDAQPPVLNIYDLKAGHSKSIDDETKDSIESTIKEAVEF